MKRFMKFIRIISVSCIVLSSLVCRGQEYAVANNAAANEIKKTILAVVIKEEDEKRTKELKAFPDELKEYRHRISVYNQNIETIVKREWKYSPAVEIISEAKADDLRNIGSDDYSLLEYVSILGPDASGQNYTASTIDVLRISRPRKPKRFIAISTFNKLSLDRVSLILHVQQLGVQLEDCQEKSIRSWPDLKDQMERKSSELQNRTVYLCKDWMYDDDVKKLHENENLDLGLTYKVVEIEELERAILAHDTSVAYVISAGNRSFFVDAVDGRFMHNVNLRYVASKISLDVLEKAAKSFKKQK